MKISKMVLLATILSISATATAAEDTALLASAKAAPNAKLGPILQHLYQEYLSSSQQGSDFSSRNQLLRTQAGMISIDGFASDNPALESQLLALGASNVRTAGRLFSARVPVSALGELAQLPGLVNVTPSLAKTNSTQGPVLSQGDLAMAGPSGRAAADVDGAGIRIGLLSDSFGCDPEAFSPGQPSTTSAEDRASGEVDPELLVVADPDECAGLTDEGRAMAQLANDVAPGSAQSFHTAFNSRLDFALGILEMAGVPTGLSDIGFYSPVPDEISADVLVDDVIYFVEPMFSEGQIAQAANIVAHAHKPYFSSAGNNARNSYEADFAPAVRGGSAGRTLNGGNRSLPARSLRHNFATDGSVDDTQTITVQPDNGQAITVLSFQWNQPHATSTLFANYAAGDYVSPPVGATSDVDVLLYKANGALVPFCPTNGRALGLTCQLTGVNNIGGDAVELVVLFHAGPAKQTAVNYQLSVVVSAGNAPGRIKYVPFDIVGTASISEHVTNSGTAFGHANAREVGSVAASAFYFTPTFDGDPAITSRIPSGTCLASACLEDFSSAGGIPLFTDPFGSPFATPITPLNPLVTGPDGGNTSFFFFDSSFDDDDGDGRNSPFSTFVTPELDDPADEIPNFFGTSASAPHVAGAAALILQKARSLDLNLTSEQVYGILANTAQPVNKRAAGYAPTLVTETIDDVGPEGFNFDGGFGLVDVEAALAEVVRLADS